MRCLMCAWQLRLCLTAYAPQCVHIWARDRSSPCKWRNHAKEQIPTIVTKTFHFHNCHQKTTLSHLSTKDPNNCPQKAPSYNCCQKTPLQQLLKTPLQQLSPKDPIPTTVTKTPLQQLSPKDPTPTIVAKRPHSNNCCQKTPLQQQLSCSNSNNHTSTIIYKLKPLLQ